MPYPEMEHTTKFKLTLIAKKAREQPKLKFISLIHLLNAEYLRECFSELQNRKAPGVDGRTKESYSPEEVTAALIQVVADLKAHGYRPQPVRRVFIPKANGQQRPLGIPTVMDKTLQLACAKILEPIFEPLFLNCSYGFRPRRNAQGGIISPILANIYLHYVLDLWFEVKEKPSCVGYANLVRYADDFVIGVQHRHEAEKIPRDIRERFAQFGLTLAEDKTRILEFGRFARMNARKRGGRKPATFDFLGFTHYCSQTRDGRFAHKVKTSRKKFTASLVRQKEWFKAVRNRLKLREIWALLTLKAQGHYQYYGMSGNFESIKSYYQETERQAYKWLNRRSQKKTWNWDSFREYLARYPLPLPKLTYAFYHTW